MLREKYPEMPLGLTTMGIGLANQAGQFASLGVTRVTLLVNAVNPQTVKKLYTWIRPGKRNIPLAKGADILVEEQAKGIAACIAESITVSLLTTVYCEINEQEVEEIARTFSGLGAEYITLLPGKGWLAGDEQLPLLSVESMEGLVRKAGKHIATVCLRMPQPLGDIIPMPSGGNFSVPKPTQDKPNVAVLSSNGMDIDLHLGQAIRALIYGPREDGLACLLEARDLPEPGSGDTRWLQVGEILNDCFALLATSAGQKPREILDRQGISMLFLEDSVEGAVDALFGGGRKGKGKK
jgi:nitrogen fixation protein NifB